MSQNFLGNTLYSKRAGKIISFLHKNNIFLNYFKKHLIKIYTNTHQIAPFFKIFWEDLLNPVMYAHLFIEKKITLQKVHFFQFLKDPLQFIKITLHWLHQLKKIYFHGICALSKKYV